MKNYRLLVPIVLVVLMVASWYMIFSKVATTGTEYENYLKEARKYTDLGITKYAMENYEKALAIKQDVDVCVEIANYYKGQGDIDDYTQWCERFFETFPKEPKAYDCIVDAYLMQEDYESCFDILSTADKRKITSEYMTKVRNEIAYVYDIGFGSYTEVGAYSSGLCAVYTDDLWGFVDTSGKTKIKPKYIKVGCFTPPGVASVVNSNGEAYFLDTAGDKVMVTKDKYNSFGLLASDMMAAVKTDGRYTYLNADFKVLFGDYDYASTMNGLAAVRNGEQWQLINTEGKAISKTQYVDIKLDDKEVAFRNGRAFVATSAGKYIMIDESGKQVGKYTFEDARVFLGDAPTAVKIDGKWAFINAEGKLISSNKYDDARAFSNGLAAVCIDGKWGFVDSAEKVVIEPQFLNAKDFNEKGGCFVMVDGDKWSLLTLYRLN